MQTKVIPVLRIFDVTKAIEFYIDWLGFQIDWEHRFDENAPLYMQVSREDVTLHLSEHHGDSTPGAKVFIETEGVRELHSALTEKQYKYNRPGLEEAFYGAWELTLHDPFGNRLLYVERFP
ncbi:glyoxalase superfamily protein [Chitinophaga deserti]|uniref:glyoxalase superfamily protein n=1 Tax=Chitinophaga deserti TaxID=2164099 RepID=UPI000D6D70B3|nr:glyoxalase superfamily protein [Chitinophaga deserti]